MSFYMILVINREDPEEVEVFAFGGVNAEYRYNAKLAQLPSEYDEDEYIILSDDNVRLQ